MFAAVRNVFAKPEYREGEPVFPTGDELADTDAFLALDPEFTYEKEDIDIPVPQTSLSPRTSLIGIESMAYSFGLLMRGTVLPAEPEWAKFFHAGGFSTTVQTYTQVAAQTIGTITSHTKQVTHSITIGTHGRTDVDQIKVVVAGVTRSNAADPDVNGTWLADFSVSTTTVEINVDTSSAAGTYSGGTIVAYAVFSEGETLNFITSTETATLLVPGDPINGSNPRLVHAAASGALTDNEEVRGATSKACVKIDGANHAQSGGFKWGPVSQIGAITTMLNGSWSNGDPVADDTIKVSGEEVYGRVISYDSGSKVLTFEPIIGNIDNADVLEIVGSSPLSTNTVNNPLLNGASLSQFVPLTLEDRRDGLLRQGTGGRNNITLQFQAGQPVRVNVAGQALMRKTSDFTHDEGAVSITNALPQLFRSATVTIDGIEFAVAGLTIDFGCQLAIRLDPSAAQGARSYRVTGYQPQVTIDPEMVLGGVLDFHTKWKNATTVKIEVLMDGIPGFKYYIKMGAVQVNNVVDGERDGQLVGEITGTPTQVAAAGDDHIEVYLV